MIGRRARRRSAWFLLCAAACTTDAPLENRSPTLPESPDFPIASSSTSSDTLQPAADAHTKSLAPNKNFGAADSLTVRSFTSSSSRFSVYVRFDQAALESRIGTGQLDSAHLQFYLRDGGGWPAAGDWLNAYRIPNSWAPGGWTEAGITANCPNEISPANATLDCPGGVWDTTGLGAMTPTDQVLLNNDTREWITFDVSTDIAGYMAGTVNHGWYVAKQSNSNNERIVFWSREASLGPRLILFVTHDDPVPAEAPDTLPDWVYAPTNQDSNTTALPGVFLKNIVIVEFKPSATPSQRQAAVDSVAGTVVGGVPSIAGEGHYYLQVPDTTRGGGLVGAVQKLGSLPQVQLATYEFDVVPMYRKPRDDPDNWSSWHIDRKTLTGQNWALEAVLAPLAWGCATGDSSLRIAVVDGGFPNLPANHDLDITVHPAPEGGSAFPGDHGIRVSSILAARGDNQQGMTGVMWNSDLHGYDAGAIADSQHAFVGRVLQQIKNAADGGARVINLSLGVQHDWPDSTRALAGRGLDSTLSALGARGRRPLVVLAAGNSTMDASVAGFPRATTGTNADQIVVVAASTKDSTLWAGGEGGKGSNFGPLVTVAAPGRDVFSLSQGGSIVAGAGTSTSAPIVSGIAGLLLSFDSRLEAKDLKEYIVNGAVAGNWKATRPGGQEQYPIVNAYESLKLAAERVGAPLCGNRIWTKDRKVYASRRGTDEKLFQVDSVQFKIGKLIAHHDGRRLDLLDHTVGMRAWLWNNGAWNESPAALGDDGSPSGVAWSLFGMSHDGVQETWYEYHPDYGDPGKVTIPRWDGNTIHDFEEIDVQPTRGDSTCVWEKWSGGEWVCYQFVWAGNSDSIVPNLSPAFSPPGDSVFAVLPVERTTITVPEGMSPCLWSTIDSTGHQTDQCVTNYIYERRPLETRVYRLKYPGGGKALFATLSNLMVYSNAITEDGREFINEEGMDREQYTMVQLSSGGFTIGEDYQRTFTDCAVSYRRLGDFQHPLRRVETDDACEAYGGVGSGAALRGPSRSGNRFHELVKRHLARPRSAR